MKRSLPLVSVFAALIFLAACEDPSNVGLGLIDDPISPSAESVPLTTFEPASITDRTGNTHRVLAGLVEDPALGTIEATGYLNFTRPDDAEAPSAPVDSVVLSLSYNYVYGDTTETLSLDLRDIETDERWSGSGMQADSSLPLGEQVTTVEITPEDTTQQVHLPEEWIEEHEDVLVSDDFNDLFTGLALSAADGSTALIRGFERQALTLTVYTEEENVTAFGTDAFTELARADFPALPSDVVVFQDGVPPDPDASPPTGSRLRVDFDIDEFENQAVNGARLELQLDEEPFEDTPDHFVRPEPSELRLIGADEDGEIIQSNDVPLLSVVASFEDDGQVFFQSSDQQSFGLVDYIQDELIGDSRFDDITHLELRVPTNENTIDPLLFLSDEGGESAPVLRITLSGD